MADATKERWGRRRHSVRSAAVVGGIRGGTIINVVVAVIFFGLLVIGIWWIIKTFGQASQQYTGALIEVQYTATTVKCQTNLRAIWQNLQMYAVSNETMPPSLEAIKEWSGDSRLFRCPEQGGPVYIYIPGQGGDMPATNVLVYEPAPVHEGRGNVLRLGGQIELLTLEELKEALAATLSNIKQKRGP